MTDAEVASWLDRNGYGGPMILRYGEWLGVVPGWTREADDGTVTGRCIDRAWTRPRRPTVLRAPAGGPWVTPPFRPTRCPIRRRTIAADRHPDVLGLRGDGPCGALVGVLAGMREGSRTDRSLSTFAIASTATPEYVSGVIFIVLLASSTAGLSPWLAENGWIEGRTLFLGSARSAMEDGINFWNFTLPVMTIALYGMGYIARMTRASMAEVMTAQYIRTARLKGVSFRNIVVKHALRNALIAPFTVIMLQFPWLLTGVVIVETLFNYNGFGWTLVQAASNNDIELLLACSIVAVFVVLVTQLISDIGYVFLNPRIRIA
jgi:peptide/nickel transport system permease protein